MIISVDFDDTIALTTFPTICCLRPFAQEVLQELHDNGHYIIVNTCRCGDELIAAVNFMLENNIAFDRINDNHPELVRKHGTNSRKIYADLYVDDHNFGGFENWVDVRNYINSKTWESL